MEITTPAALPTGLVGQPYGLTLQAVGGQPPYQWQLDQKQLPAGLSFDAATGVISGTPTQIGMQSVLVTVRDSSVTPQRADKYLTFLIQAVALAITTLALPEGKAGQIYQVQLKATGGLSPYTWSVTGLPAGLSLSAETGYVSGTPPIASTSSCTFSVLDRASQTASRNLELVVAGPLVISTTALPAGHLGQAYSTELQAAGGTSPYAWSVTGLPSGLSLDATSGVVSGAPLAAGTSSCDVTVTDHASNTSSRLLPLVVGAPLSIGSAPVGSIIAWAGLYPMIPGWVLCDGRSYPPSQYAELYAVIGTIYGSPSSGDQLFCVPNLSGQFLRGVTHASTTDPDALTRTAPQPLLNIPGNSANQVGSVQTYGTAQPHSPFQAAIYGLPTGTNSCQSPAGAPDDICISHPDLWDKHWTDTSGGGDKETRPVNKSVWYLIKANATSNGGAVSLPVGSVIACAAPDTTAVGGFIFCDGRQAASDNVALFDAIGIIHGGSDVSNYYLPDFRGYFLRGTGYPPTYDPEARERGPARPDLPPGQQGKSGVNPGSTQGWATGLPMATFQTNFLWCPDDGVHAWNSVGSRNGLTNSGNSVTVTLTGPRGTAGDAESRPINYAVDWLIKAEADAEPPVGAVIAYGGNLPLPSASADWRPCHGQTIQPSDPAFATISAAIGTTYGADGAGIKLPDYRGMFLRGRDCGMGRDPDGKERAVGSLEQFATGAPSVPFTATPANLPDHGEQVMNSGPHDPGNWPDGDFTTIPTNTRGGDKETRPINGYVEFLIRVS